MIDIVPSISSKFLGIDIHSKYMVFALPFENRIKIKKLVEALNNDKVKIHELASFIALFVAACLAVAYGRLFSKELDRQKSKALVVHRGNMSKWADLSVGTILKNCNVVLPLSNAKIQNKVKPSWYGNFFRYVEKR